ncbi:metal ABC transporter permease [Candidatus Roizmanbacteria bacterium]|nr:metal ABC transporter permease [Candidatus Roizmanbacteria bacterium]
MFDLFTYDFMIRAFLAGALVGIIAPIIGLFLVVRRYSLMADTLAHVSLVGVAGALISGGNPVVGALIASILAAFGIEHLRSSRKLYGESVLALFLSGSLALAVIIMGLAHGINVNFLSYLFGSIVTVSQLDLLVIASLGLLTLALMVVCYRQLFFISFDEELAKANGLPVKLLNIILIVLTALTVSVSMRIVGILLVGALMVIPALTAIQYGKSFKKTLVLGVLFSLSSVLIGLYSSYYLNVASGGTIVVVTLLFFTISLIFNRKG